MNLHKCILTENDCYKAGKTIRPTGIVVHSTGGKQPEPAALRSAGRRDSWQERLRKPLEPFRRRRLRPCVHRQDAGRQHCDLPDAPVGYALLGLRVRQERQL